MRIASSLFIASAAAIGTGCSSHAYYDEALQYVKATNMVLISFGQCTSEQNCREKKLIFFEAGGFQLGPLRTGGVHVSVYQQSSIETVSLLETELMKVHTRIGGPTVTLTAFTNRYSERKIVLKKFTLK